MLQLTLSCGTSFQPPLSVAYPFPIHFLVAFEKGANAAETAVEKGKNAAEAVLEKGETATEAGHALLGSSTRFSLSVTAEGFPSFQTSFSPSLGLPLP